MVNPHELSGDGRWEAGTDSDGVLDFSLINSTAELTAIIRALRSNGDYRSLAEPNLLALDGQEAVMAMVLTGKSSKDSIK